MDLQDLANLGEILGGLAVLVGVVFALVQLRDVRGQRREAAAVDIIRAVQTQDIRRAAHLVLVQPNDLPPERVRSDPQLLAAALAMDSACEMWGSMVFEGVVPIHMLDRMAGGWVRGAWAKLRLWVEDERKRTGNVNIAEWWQWVVERITENPDPGKASGAYVFYRHWRG